MVENVCAFWFVLCMRLAVRFLRNWSPIEVWDMFMVLNISSQCQGILTIHTATAIVAALGAFSHDCLQYKVFLTQHNAIATVTAI